MTRDVPTSVCAWAKLTDAQMQNKCAVCDEEFESRTKLFKHIKDENHVGLKPATQAGKSGKKKR